MAKTKKSSAKTAAPQHINISDATDRDSLGAIYFDYSFCTGCGRESVFVYRSTDKSCETCGQLNAK